MQMAARFTAAALNMSPEMTLDDVQRLHRL